PRLRRSRGWTDGRPRDRGAARRARAPPRDRAAERAAAARARRGVRRSGPPARGPGGARRAGGRRGGGVARQRPPEGVRPRASDVAAAGVCASAIAVCAPLADVARLGLAVEGLVYELNGAVVATNAGAEVMGNPLNSLAWVANHLGARGLALKAGDLVMSGSVSMLLRPKAGDTVRATFTRLGSVAVRFA